MEHLEIKEAYYNIEEIKALFNEYTSSLGVDLAYQNYSEEFSNLPDKYVPPSGRLYIAYVDGIAAGCVGLRKIDEQTCEMKRLYVRYQFRGFKLGRLLAERVILESKSIGYQSMVLDTLSTMENALFLYKNLGFVEIAPYYDCPISGTHFLCLALCNRIFD